VAGVRALQRTAGNRAVSRIIKHRAAEQVQRNVYLNMPAMWNVVYPGYALANVQQDAVLASLYEDAEAQLPLTDIVQVANQAPQASVTPSPPAPTPYRVEWDTPANVGFDDDYFAGAILHELANTRTYAFARRMLNEANDRRRNGFWSAPDTEVRRVDSRAWWFQFWRW